MCSARSTESPSRSVSPTRATPSSATPCRSSKTSASNSHAAAAAPSILTRRFEEYMQYLADNKFQVIALRDLAKYVDPTVTPSDPWGVIKDRQRLLEAKRSGENARPAAKDAELRFWLENMAVYHRFTLPE